MGSGVAFLDYDGDGWQDLYLVQSGRFPPAGGEEATSRLFRNAGGGRFLDVTEVARAGENGYGQGVVAADVDGDGAVDLYVANYGADALLRNRGDGTFEPVTGSAGLGAGGWSSSAAFADADGDGDLDLYVTRYLEYDPDHGIFCGDPETGARRYCDPSLFAGARDVYYVNEGAGRFREATAAVGIAPADGRGLGVVFVDLDGDRAPDLYVANDLTVNLLFRNRGDGRFEDLSLLSGAAVNREGKPEAGMGIAVADPDGDGDPDLAVTNFDVETNTLYRNHGDLGFEDVSAASGFGLPSFNLLGFGIVPGNFDLDGDVDYLVANGHIFQNPLRKNVTYAQPPLLLVGDGRGGFTAATCAELLDLAVVARGLAAGDLDNDGRLDLVMQVNDGAARLLAGSDQTLEDRWLGVRLEATGGNREQIGATVTLATAAGSQRRWIQAGDSYQSSSDRRALFALPYDEPPRALSIEWPGGGTTRHVRPPRGRYLVVGSGRRP
jgi:hypothetical protein